MNWLLLSIISFSCTAFAEFFWVLWMRRVAQGRAFGAAFFGSSTWLIGAIVVLSYTANRWMLIPAFLGSFISGYLTVKYDVKKSKNKTLL
jgi:general stress protein CsbA